MMPRRLRLSKKRFFDRRSKFSGRSKRPENLSIKNERDPSWVPLVTLLLPVEGASLTLSTL